MNVIDHRAFRLVCLFSAALLGLVTPLYPADSASTNPATAPSPGPASARAIAAYTPEQKAALDVVDSVIARYESLVNRDDDAKHQAAARAVLDDFKKRRTAIGQAYDQGRYDELRVDLNLEYQRLASWMAPAITPSSMPKTDRPAATTAPK